MKIEAGAVLVLTMGEYSDYQFSGPFRVLKAFDQAELVDNFRQQWKPKDEWETDPDAGEFLPWLIQNGYVEDIEAISWHLGSYRFKPEIQQ